MPHCIIEYSENILDKPEWKKLLEDLHEMMNQTGLFNVNDIKSRVVRHDVYYIGDGDSNRAFVTLNIQILSGRESSVKASLSKSALKILEKYFPLAKKQMKLSLTVQISNLDRDSYRKFVNNK